MEIDTVLHSTWSCVRIVPYLMHVFEYLKTKCIAGVDINMKNYLFGFHGHQYVGLNHILLELKKYIFYNWEENVRVNTFFERFERKIMHLIVKEKHIAIGSADFETFCQKWEYFIEFYDFRGPDCQIIG